MALGNKLLNHLLQENLKSRASVAWRFQENCAILHTWLQTGKFVVRKEHRLPQHLQKVCVGQTGAEVCSLPTRRSPTSCRRRAGRAVPAARRRRRAPAVELGQGPRVRRAPAGARCYAKRGDTEPSPLVQTVLLPGAYSYDSEYTFHVKPWNNGDFGYDGLPSASTPITSCCSL